MHNVLNKIVERKRKDIETAKKTSSLDNFRVDFSENSPRKFRDAIARNDEIAIIAEIKLASPTNPYLGPESEIIDRAIAYQNAKANALSFITEKHYFKGDISYIPRLRDAVTIPILQKDFVIDPYQIYEAKEAGSDALLFIARLVNKETLTSFVSLSQELGIEPVVEINNEKDLDNALTTNTAIIAVNARDLDTFHVDVPYAATLLSKIPDTYIKLGFSGITSSDEVAQYKKAGAHGVLVGTSLMKSQDITTSLKGLRI